MIINNLTHPEVQYNFYYGIPHAHTGYSDGEGTALEAYEYARNNGLDFLIVTDHLGSLSNSEYNIGEKILYKGRVYSKWEITKIEASKINKKYNDFLALVGFEMNTKIWGHMNVINSSDILHKKTCKDIQNLYGWLCNQQNIILSINHPFNTSKKLQDFIRFNKLVNLIEVGNGSPPFEYRRFEDYYFNALDCGWYVGAMNGQDNHLKNWGDPDNITVVIAENLNTDSIITAMKLRRVYSTESRTLKLTVKGNNQWMGSILRLHKKDKLQLQIIAEDKSTPISKIQIISNGGVILKEKKLKDSNRAEWDLSIKNTKKFSWYVIKVIHSNGKCGIASPIFVR